jgi:hypothetical protein
MDHRKPVAAVRSVDDATRTVSIYLDKDAEVVTGMALYASPFQFEGTYTFQGFQVYGEAKSILKLHELLQPKLIDNGGPAFPWGEHGVRLGGINMLDYFASSALPEAMAVLAAGGSYDNAADLAYELGAAMMRARAKVMK